MQKVKKVDIKLLTVTLSLRILPLERRCYECQSSQFLLKRLEIMRV